MGSRDCRVFTARPGVQLFCNILHVDEHERKHHLWKQSEAPVTTAPPRRCRTSSASGILLLHTLCLHMTTVVNFHLFLALSSPHSFILVIFMTKLRAHANLAAVVVASLDISVVLFDITTTKAGRLRQRRQSPGSRDCFNHQVLKCVQPAMLNARSVRISMGNIETAQDILDRSRKVFGELETSLPGLHTTTGVNDMGMARWTLRRTRVRELQERLRTLFMQLHIVFTTKTLCNSLRGMSFQHYALQGLAISGHPKSIIVVCPWTIKLQHRLRL